MSDTGNQDQGETIMGRSELEMLKERAKVMNITHSNNIGVEALRAKINAKLNGEEEPAEVLETPNALEAGLANMGKALEKAEEAKPVEAPARIMTLREYLIKENMMLLRCRITNLDPKKKDLPGEIITVANEHLGTVRKFIPYGEATENGFHIPKILYEFLKSRKFTNISVTKKDGKEHVSTRDVAEFSLEILDPLTTEELNDLKQAQIAAGSIE
jgi:hypothetical protein